MDLMEEMWISRPQRRMTKLSDLSDGSIARIKFYNANTEGIGNIAGLSGRYKI